MRKFLTGALCALTLASSSCFSSGKEESKTVYTYQISKKTKEGYIIRLWKEKDTVSILLEDTKGEKDLLYLNDNDFSKQNGIESVSNWTTEQICFKKNKPECGSRILSKANLKFKYALNELGFDSKMKPKKGVLGGWYRFQSFIY